MNLRKFLFNLTDRNNVVKNHLYEIQKANEDDLFYEKLHEKNIAGLITHVKESVPFYAKCSAVRLEDFPVVNKVMMKDDISSFRSSKPLTIGKIRHTSGSTGIPFEIFQDLNKAKRVQAELIYYRQLTGDELGTKFINLNSPSRVENLSKFGRFKQNVVSFDVTKMDDNTLEQLHQILLHNHKIYYMFGYASALEKIANYFIDRGYKEKYSLTAIVSNSELLTETTINKLKAVFNCSIYDRYSNEDNGFLAQTNADGTHEFYVNRASYFIEILKMDSDEPAQENEIGRIVVTDYYNYAQPFLRYDTGDLGAYAYRIVNGSKRFVLTKLAGRQSDVLYDINNKPVSTFAIGCALEVFSNIKQYQLIQESKTEFKLNINDALKQYSLDEYQGALENVLGKGIHVTLSYMDVIPTLNSGKFKRVICNYKPSNR